MEIERESNRIERRDRKRNKARYGMRIDGASVKLAEAMMFRRREAAKAAAKRSR